MIEDYLRRVELMRKRRCHFCGIKFDTHTEYSKRVGKTSYCCDSCFNLIKSDIKKELRDRI